MKAMKQDVNMQNSVNLEINTKHELIKNLSALKDKDADTAKLVAEQILDNALISAGYLEDPRDNTFDEVYFVLDGNIKFEFYDPKIGKTWIEELEQNETVIV